MSPGEFFAERRARADFTALGRLTWRKGGGVHPRRTIRLPKPQIRPLRQRYTGG